ncbi:L-threonine O-3-phosphate decarboxylase [Sulfitobacter marinus]|uniref:threonine-phosphate decarboxylase n=1 Tax=Sulfitobacter marinus TaxID=394264 RepID=A0A1I6RU54_9RHOB|nr:threonine-phosphate decarboxylase CobD [Sulfitobacter marinus]SFS68255.1 L-threonine O-3-phosphate decarboxylase [Sulfitobacter marinus]
MRDHGGNMGLAISEFGGDPADWIDLSTGINATPYPVGQVPAAAWARLPEHGSLAGLEGAAQRAYRTSLDVVAVAGAQAAIQLVPMLTPAGRAAVLTPTYNEHAAALRSGGWDVQEVAAIEALEGYDLAVVVNPNNPDGKVYPPQTLLALSTKVGLLIVDESFADPEPEMSLASGPQDLPGNVVILRSFGKFYGLAGVRLGFVLGVPAVAGKIRDMVGPWPVSGMAIDVCKRAFEDDAWAEQTRRQLRQDAARLDVLATDLGWQLVGGTSLFRTYATRDAAKAQRDIATHHIWTRVFPYSDSWIRLGLPGSQGDWSRLEAAMKLSASAAT